MGRLNVDVRHNLLVELLEDRRVLSGFSVLPLPQLPSLLEQPLPSIVQETLPSVEIDNGGSIAVEAEVLGLNVDLHAAPTLDALSLGLSVETPLVDAPTELDAGLSLNQPLTNLAVETEVLGLDTGLEVAAVVNQLVDLGLDVFLEQGSQPVLDVTTGIDIGLGSTLLPVVDASTDLGFELGPVDISVETGVAVGENAGPGVDIDVGGSLGGNPVSPLPDLPGSLPVPNDGLPIVPDSLAGAGGFNDPGITPAPTSLDGRFFTEEALFVNEETRNRTDTTERREEGLRVDEDEVTLEGLRIPAKEEESWFDVATRVGRSPARLVATLEDPSENIAIRELSVGLTGEEAALLDQAENLGLMGDAFDDFFQNLLGVFEAFKTWLARIGPVPWVMMGLALGLSGMELASRYRRRMHLRRSEADTMVEAGLEI